MALMYTIKPFPIKKKLEKSNSARLIIFFFFCVYIITIKPNQTVNSDRVVFLIILKRKRKKRLA